MPNHKKVIPFQSGEWRYLDFILPSGNNPIEQWYQKELSDEGRFSVDGLLKVNRHSESPTGWTGFKRFLKGKFAPYRIWELQFYDQSQSRTYRILGTFGAARKHAVILLGCYHKGSVYTPTDALDTALRRAKMLARNEGGLCERKIKIYI